METLYLICTACNNEFILGKNLDFTLKCGHFRCETCSIHSNTCKLDGVSEKFDTKELIEGFCQKNPKIFNLVCEVHKSPLECYCKTCELLLCYRCALRHREHVVLEESELQSILPEITEFIYSYFFSVLFEYNQTLSEIKSIKDCIKLKSDQILQLKESLSEVLHEKNQELKYQMDLDFDIFYKIHHKSLKKCVDFCSVFQEVSDLSTVLSNYTHKKSQLLKNFQENTEFLLHLPEFQIEDLTFEFYSWPSTQFITYMLSEEELSIEERRYIESKCK